jgi:diguanylate cyclase (GGDEF)-like protein
VIRMRRPGPLASLTLALVTMTMSIIVLADVLLGFSGRDDQHLRAMRQQLAESVAVQTAALLQADEAQALERSMRETLLRIRGLRSIGLRRDDGTLLVAAGPHEMAWQRSSDPKSTTDQVRVMLSANGRAWGAVEFAYQPDKKAWWAELIGSPLTRLLLFIAVVGSLAYGLYLRRALQHLDPSSVIPERVQRAFDAMAEGVVVLDARARVMLANRAFRAMGGPDSVPRIGQPLSSLDWLAAALPADPASSPWARAMSARQNTFDDALVLPGAGQAMGSPHEAAPPRSLVVNCAPILDNGGAVRGCMVTVNDLTELHRVNDALHRTLGELKANQEDLRQSNEKLHRLATRDALTGCLNRRAFMEEATLKASSASGMGAAVGCLMLDIDHFKSVNDTHGHGIGDRVITEVASVLLGQADSHAVVGRYGGEEFCIVVPISDTEATAALGERIRATVEAEVGARITEVTGMRVTISVGVSQWDGSGDTLAAMLDRADQGLYRAKRSGRNRVAHFTAAAPTPVEVPA